jgi:predicted amino acid dehydrogenase
MKWNVAAAALFLAVASTTPSTTDAFGISSAQVANKYNLRPQNQASAFVSSSNRHFSSKAFKSSSSKSSSSSLDMSAASYTVGIVGATGAVGKEIRQCLETRNFPVKQLRIFGSARSAGTVQKTSAGAVTIELFDLQTARECDVVFLAVSGDFSLEHAEALAAGDDGCVVIDNSVRDDSITILETDGCNICSTYTESDLFSHLHSLSYTHIPLL